MLKKYLEMIVCQVSMCSNNSILDQLVQYFRKSGYVKVVLVALGLSHFFNVFFGIMSHYLDHLNIHFSPSPDLSGKSFGSLVISNVIIVPVLETFLFQLCIYKLLRCFRFFQSRIRYIILVSAFIFGVAHCYHVFYMISTFFIGIILMVVYISKIENEKLAFWLVTLIHALDNLITISLFCLLETCAQ